MNETKHEPTPGEQLRKALVGHGSDRAILARPYDELPAGIREAHELVAAEFLAPYLARIAELEKIIAGLVEPKASIHQPLRCCWQHESELSDWFRNHTPQEAAQEFADEDEQKTDADTILVEDESGKIVARFAACLEWELKLAP